ncbi:MAG: diaminopimelate epimerase [Rikenellaceae bacterium]
MDKIKYILCHGSGNRFVMIDAVERDLTELQTADFVQKVCQSNSSDGVLFLVQKAPGFFAMRMFNTDGSEAEMCGNGMRCAARLVYERYHKYESFKMGSGRKIYNITHQEQIAAGVETFSVDIDIATCSDDFLLTADRFVGKRIEELDPELYFTYLNLGNPHIVALCDEIDLDHLTRLGEKVKTLPAIFPNGVNVSMMKYMSAQQIFVATFERGVGLTPSCGTAMTASCTVSILLGVCREEMTVEVRNRGGMVYCTTSLSPSIVTTLTGNATFDSVGYVNEQGEILELEPVVTEQEAWGKFVESLQ